MKKMICIVLVVMFAFNITPCFAKEINSYKYEVDFEISDDWVEQEDKNGLTFYYKHNPNEFFRVQVVKTEWAYMMDQISESYLESECSKFYSDAALIGSFSTKNNAIVSIKTNSVLTSYKTYNKVTYYRYEKAYVLSADGFADTEYYSTAFVTAKNGNIYYITYSRPSDSNHFADIYQMLNSISFAKGEIKILVNGTRIFPDNPPLLIDDRTLVPIRAIAEKMGYSVGWNEEKQLVTLESKEENNVLYFLIGDNVAMRNLKEEIKLDVPAVVINDRTYLPLRAVAEAMDAKVSWNNDEKMVDIWQ